MRMQGRWGICVARRNSTCQSAWIFNVALGVALLAGGCGTPPRVDAEAAHAVARASGLAEPVAFRQIDADGGSVDEPERVGNLLSMASAVRLAVTTDPRLQAALARVRIAMADAQQARLLPNPLLSVVVRWGPGKSQVEASLAQELVQLMQVRARTSGADHRLRAAAAEAVTTGLDVVCEVQERYAAAQGAGAIVPVLMQRLELVGKLLATAEARLNAGEGTRADVLTLQAQVVELQVEIDQSRLIEREERLRLARLIGEPSRGAGWKLDEWTTPLPVSGVEAAWVDAALLHRPEVQAIAWKLRALGDDAALARMLPWEGSSIGADVQRDDGVYAGPAVSVPLPLFDTGQAQRERVSAEQIEARNELILIRRKVVEDVRLAFDAFAANGANLERIRRELLPLQQRRQRVAEEAYRAGQTDVTSLYLAEHDLRVAQARAIEVERQVVLAQVRLQRAVGGVAAAAGVNGDRGMNVEQAQLPRE